jgi:hypothetical protein
MSGVAIIGSCVTRDALRTSKLGEAELTLISRAGFASLTARPIEGLTLPPILGSLTPGGWPDRCVRCDIEKTARGLIERQRPDVVLIDFMDDRFNLLVAGGSVFCESLEFIDSGLASREPFKSGRRVNRLSGEAWRLWLDGLTRFGAWTRRPSPSRTRLVLHRAYMAMRWQHDDGIGPPPPSLATPDVTKWVLGINAVLARQHAAFLDAFPDALIIDVPPELRIADPGHVWGPGAFHYIEGYYAAFRVRARALGIDLSLVAD